MQDEATPHIGRQIKALHNANLAIIVIIQIFSRDFWQKRRWVITKRKSNRGSSLALEGLRRNTNNFFRDGYEMPVINYSMFNSKKYRYVYGTSVFSQDELANSLIKLDNVTEEMKIWNEGNTLYPSEDNTQPTSRIRTLTSTFAGLKEDTGTKDSLAADQS
ncbi:hypothetical protein TNCV_4900671 [Trichonephila clavipes]|nr:hypothetical protein TNCV_4900671 [Trichonephila clavipes]